MILLWLATLLPLLYWDAGPETAAALQKAGITRIAVPPARERQWKGRKGVSTSVVDLKGLTEVPVPSIQHNLNEASATRRPWIDLQCSGHYDQLPLDGGDHWFALPANVPSPRQVTDDAHGCALV